MQPQLIFSPHYNGRGVTFDFTNGDGLINATHMAKIFDQDPNEFIRLPSTERFIAALVKDENRRQQEQATTESSGIDTDENDGFIPGLSRNETVEITRDEVLKTVRGGRHSGTWMHRLLAIKFAAWLDVDFEIWVFRVIDNFMNAGFLQHQQELNGIAEKEKRRIELEGHFAKDPQFKELQSLRASKQAFINRPKQAARTQLALILETRPESDSNEEA